MSQTSQKMSRLRLILKSLPVNCNEPHPQAKPGTLYDYKRANDKMPGKTVYHYAQRGELYFVQVSK